MTFDQKATVLHHLNYVSETIGARPIGSASNLATAEYIQNVFDDLGLETRKQKFECPSWSLEKVQFDLNGTKLPAVANTFSPPGDIIAPIVSVSTLTELERADLSQHMAVLYGDLSKDALAPLNSPVYIPEPHRQIGQLLRRKKPLALILVSAQLEPCLPMVEDWELPVPSISVPPEVGLMLLQSGDSHARLQLASHRTSGISYNIIGKTQSISQERIVICAHYDTKFETPGAFDNGSGLAAMLTLSKILTQIEAPANLEFIAFSGEEYNGLGDEVYLQEYGLTPIPFGGKRENRPTGLDHILTAINIDGIGQRLGTTTVSTLAASALVQDLVKETLQAYPKMILTDPWPASNHYTFYSHGVPSIVLGNRGGANIMHRPDDTIKWIDIAALSDVVSFVQTLIKGLQRLSPSQCRLPPDNEDSRADNRSKES